MTAPPGITTGDFNGTLVPPEIRDLVLSLIIGGSPVLNSLNRINTARGSVAFPVVENVQGAAWLSELETIPSLNITDDSVVVATARLSGRVTLSMEMITDSAIDIGNQLATVLRDTFSAQAERDLFAGGGTGSAAPPGLTTVDVAGDNLWSAAVAAKAEINGSGGVASHLAATAAVLGTEEGRVDNNGVPLHDGMASLAGLQVISSANMTKSYVYDSSRLYLIVSSDFRVDSSTTSPDAWTRYGTELRVNGRLALANPAPTKTVRSVSVTPPAP